MSRDELLRALHSTVADQHRCFGCEYEAQCSVRGCAINWAAAELIEQLAAENETLRHPPNPPLTLEELRELRGDAVWIERIRTQEKEIFGEPGEYALVSLDFDAASSVRLRYSFLGYGTTWVAYRRKPEEEQHETTDNGYPEGEF